MNRRTALAVALLAIAVVAVLALKSGRKPVVVCDTSVRSVDTGATAADNLFARVRLSVAAAAERNDQAIRICEHDIDIVLAREFAEIRRKSDLAAEEVSTVSSCSTIIYRLAKEKLGSKSSTADYVDGEIHRRLQPVLDTCAREVDASLARYERSLEESTVTLAAELAQLNPSTPVATAEVVIDFRSTGDLDQALRNLGLEGGVVAVTVPFDVAAIMNMTIVRSLASRAATLAASIFAKPAATAAGSVVVAAADGPLPIGDVIAALGGVWTGYEIYSTRRQFERDLKASLANAIPEMQRDLQHRISERTRVLQSEHRNAQDHIRHDLTSGFASKELTND